MLAPFALSLLLASAAATLESCKNTADQLQLNTCIGPPEVYRVYPSEGKGLGVFSAHDLEVGDIVMREPPMLKIIPPETVKGSGYPMSAISRLVRHEFDQLPLVQQNEILSLTYHAVTPGEQDSADKLGLIFRTNAYTTGDEIGLFPKIARINHSCRPNTSYYWSVKLNRRVVYATRRIKKGEEFFVSYIPLLQTHTDRQKRLDRYGFRCSCDACTQANPQQLASDDRRVTIGQAFKDFEPQLTLTPPRTAKGRQQAKKNAKASLELTELVHKEGLADYYAKAYRVAAISHARAKQWEPAAIWANKGFELKYLEDPESPYTMELHNMTSNFIANWEHELRKTRR